ncbi:MAG: UDP-N-acetylmuramate dehydrogenase [Xanthomonadaceae bacterium]|nr:UDP-N-acetylmuramate dehydrogenase [Xanthomonadaceae bacterium]
MSSALQTARLRGELRLQESMARHTTWRTGGQADRLYRPADLTDLQLFLSQLPEDEPLTWCGLGSNLLVRDGGIRGTVILTAQGLQGLAQVGPQQVRAEAGVHCARVSKFCSQLGLAGAEFLIGIPGTIGGALAMNAGAFGSETWERVVEVETIDRRGEVRRRLPGDFEVGYRKVKGPPGEWFVACTLLLQPDDAAAVEERAKALLARRSAAQPIGKPSAGSVFRNPPGDHAARLIEASGLKGLRRGGAQVSDKHANFILNTGTASAADIEALIETVQREVYARQGVLLQPEVHIIGERLPT